MFQPSIRLLATSDLPNYKALRDAGLKSDPEAFTSDFDTETLRPAASYAARIGHPPDDHFILGAFDSENALLGSVVCLRESRLKNRHEASLAGMIVRPEARRQGIGLALMMELDSQIRRLPGVEHVVLSVTAQNLDAVRLYERAGFVRYGLLPRAIKLGERYFDKALMFKTL